MTRLFALRQWWRVRKWRRTGSMTDGELTIIRALLPKGDFRSELLLSQALDAPEVERTLVGDCGYRAIIPYVKTDKYLINVARDVKSSPLTVTDILSDRRLTFVLTILRGGYLNHLEGTADDGGNWPLDWAIDIQRDYDLAKVSNWLPPMMCLNKRESILNALALWTGTDSSKLISCKDDIINITGPASDQDIKVAEKRLNCKLPLQYKEFVRICNGLSIRFGRPYEILGTEDVYLLNSSPKFMVITPLYEEGVVVLACEGTKLGNTMVIQPNLKEPALIGELRIHVKDSLEWLKGIG